jgi:hypothetical protein
MYLCKKKQKIKKYSMRQLVHTMSFINCSIWADEKRMSNSLGDTHI